MLAGGATKVTSANLPGKKKQKKPGPLLFPFRPTYLYPCPLPSPQSRDLADRHHSLPLLVNIQPAWGPDRRTRMENLTGTDAPDRGAGTGAGTLAPPRKFTIRSKFGQARKPRSRKNRPCDACRRRKTACVITSEPPCERRRTRTKQLLATNDKQASFVRAEV